MHSHVIDLQQIRNQLNLVQVVVELWLLIQHTQQLPMLYVHLLEPWPQLFLVQHEYLKFFHAPVDTLNTLKKYYRVVVDCTLLFASHGSPLSEITRRNWTKHSVCLCTFLS
jgi:hypothetical protein